MTLEKFAGYWDKPNAAEVDILVIRNIKDNSQRLAALKAGEIQGMMGVAPTDLAVVKNDPNLQLLLKPPFNTSYIAFNFHVKEFQDVRVRLAIAKALDKKTIVDKMYGGIGLVANQLQVPALFGYNKDIQDYGYSTEEARSCLPTRASRTG